MTWRDLIPVHPAADLFPLMSKDEQKELAKDIKKNGLRYPVILWDGPDGTCLLDGRNKLDAIELIGDPVLNDDGTLKHWSIREGDPHDLVISLNVHRRHLNIAQRQELLIALIARHPERSNRQIAKTVGVDGKTIGTARAKGEQLGRIPQLEKTVGADGKARAKPKPDPDSTQEARDRAECIALDLKVKEAERELKQAYAATKKKPDVKEATAADRAEARCAAQWKAFTAQEKKRKTKPTVTADVSGGKSAAETEDGGLSPQERWRNSVSFMAGNSISLPAYWTKEFGEWEKFKVTSDISTLIKQAIKAWKEIGDRMGVAGDNRGAMPVADRCDDQRPTRPILRQVHGTVGREQSPPC